jgi:quinol monooxygenase YgiN
MVDVRDKTAEDIPALGKKLVDWAERRFPARFSSEQSFGLVHLMGHGGIIMSKLAIWAQLEAKPGKEKELEEFLKSAQPLAELEPGTLTWYAIKMGSGKYGIFDTFADENGRNAHLNGEIAKALFAKAKDLLAQSPKIDKPEILASKPAR